MKLYLQQDIETDERTLSSTQVLGGGSSGTGSIEYVYPPQIERIIRSGTFRLSLSFAITGDVSIRPVLLTRSNTGAEVILWQGETKNTDGNGNTGQAYNMVWQDQLATNHALETNRLVLRFVIANLPGILLSVLTYSGGSNLDIGILVGGPETTNVYTRSVFVLFQRREQVFLWSNVTVREKIEIPLYMRVTNKEQVSWNIYTRIKAIQNVSFDVATVTRIQDEYQFGMPYISNFQAGNFRIRGVNEIGEVERLDKVVDGLIEYPPIFTPPEPETRPLPSFVYADIADSFYRTAQLLDVEGVGIPGGTFKTFEPNNTYDGLYRYRGPDQTGRNFSAIPEWQLPTPYTRQQYSITMSMLPIKDEDNGILEDTSTLWFMIRQRPVNAQLSTILVDKPGRLVLKKMSSQFEEVLVWMWEEVIPPYNVTLIIENDTLQPPGFAGRSAAMMVGF